MEPISGHIQVYNIWVNGRDINDTNQHFPIDCNVNTNDIVTGKQIGRAHV